MRFPSTKLFITRFTFTAMKLKFRMDVVSDTSRVESNANDNNAAASSLKYRSTYLKIKLCVKFHIYLI